MKFDLPNELASIIKVIGVGGGGSNAVNHMHSQGIKGVDFIICNTDRQALDISPIPVKLQLGPELTGGLGAGSIPQRGMEAAQENLDEIRQLLSVRTKMVFITAGMGGGTGTGAAPVIARVAREMGILTVGIVTMPFKWEGRKRIQQANSGIEEMREAVDTLLVINNDRLRELFGNLTVDDAFAHADNVLTTAARGIADIINKTGKVNVDFEDVRTVMADSGVAIMGMAEAEGDERALRAAREALASPLLNDNDISGAKYVLLNVALGSSAISMDEMTEVTEHIQDAAGSTADVIWGYCVDETLGERIRVTVIATGFNLNSNGTPIGEPKPEKVVIALEGEAKPVTTPLMNPFATAVEKAPAPVASVDVLAPYIKAPEAPVTPAAPEQKTIDFGELARSSQPELKSVPQAPMTPVVSVPNPPADRTPAPPVTEELTAPVESKEEKVVHNLLDGPSEPVRNEQPAQPVAQMQTPVVQEHRSPAHSSRVDERLARMREMSLRLRSANGVSDMEREPAYRRKNVTLGDVPHSADSNVSRYTLNEETDENGERRVELRRNNPFLHDNVD